MELFRKNVGWLLALFLIGFFVYSFNLNNQLFWDDDDWIIGNRFIHELSWQNIKNIFSNDVMAGFGLSSNYYRPFLMVSFALNWAVHEATPFGYHLVSNLFHIGSAMLIFVLLSHVFNSCGRIRVAEGQRPEARYSHAAFLAALFWLIHPLNTEAVTYISGRGDPMSVFFILLALYLWINDLRSRLSTGVTWLKTLSLVTFVLAILSRETAVLFPALAMVFYLSFLAPLEVGRRARPQVLMVWQSLKVSFVKTIPFWIISVVYFFLRLTVLNFQNTLNFYSEANIYSENLSYRLFTFGHVLVEYFKLIVAPLGLHMERELPVATSLFQWPVWLGALIVLCIMYYVLRLYKNEKILNTKYLIPNTNFRIWFFGWSWFFIGLAPVSGIIPINAIIYEHWLYLPLIGFSVLVGFYLNNFLDYLKSKKQVVGRWLLVVGLITYFSFLGTLTIKRNIAWGNPIEFYEDILRYNPDTVRIINNLANLYSDKGDNERAAELYQQIIEDENGRFFAQPYYNLGNIYRDRGDVEKAIELYKQAIGVDPTFPFAYQNLAVIYVERGELSKAAEMLEIVKQLRPAEPSVYYNLALVYGAQGNTELALDNINKGLGFVGDAEIITAFKQLRDQIERE